MVAIHHDRPGPWTLAGFVVTWILFTVLTLIRPPENIVLALAPSVGFLLIGIAIWVMIAGERLIVCERGILLGSVAPFLRPYVLRYDRMVPGSIVPISGHVRRYTKELQLPPISSVVRISWWSQRGVHLVGPTPLEAHPRRRGVPVPPEVAARPSPWLIGTRGPAERAVADIARAAGATGFHHLAQLAATAPPRVLTGDPADAPSQLPGLPPRV